MREAADRHPELPLDPDVEGEPALAPAVAPVDVVLVALGGCVGTGLRYAVAEWHPSPGGAWPWATLAANLVGAFVLGVLLEELRRRGPDAGRRRRLRLLVGTGFCGGLTTYSTLAVESDLLVRAHHTGLALAYLAVSVGLGMGAVALGIALASARDGRG